MCLRYLLKGKGRWSKVARTTNRYLVQKEPDVIKKRNVKWKTGNYIRLKIRWRWEKNMRRIMMI